MDGSELNDVCFFCEVEKKSRIDGRKKIIHKGIDTERLKFPSGDLERAFARLWEKQNKRRPGLNYGMGTLQDLMVRRSESAPYGHSVPYWITQREATIVATIIQWLGTNCGFAFLCQALGDCDIHVESTEAYNERLKKTNRKFREAEEHKRTRTRRVVRPGGASDE